MISFVLALVIAVSYGEVPENNTFIPEYKPPFAKKLEKKAKAIQATMAKKACAPFLDPVECDVLARVNALRAEEGLSTLLPAEKCTSLAHSHTQYMVGLSNKGTVLNHALNHDKFKERVESFGLAGGKASENVAAGTNLMPEQLVSMWMKSQGHRQNILDPAVRYTGLSAIKDSKGNIFWTQCFSSKK